MALAVNRFFLISLCILPGWCQENMSDGNGGRQWALFSGGTDGVVLADRTGRNLSRLLYYPVSVDAGATLNNLQYTTKAETSYFELTNIDVIYQNRTIVAFDRGRKEIMEVTFDSSETPHYRTLFMGTSRKVNGLAVDVVNDVVYWTDAAYHAIFLVSRKQPFQGHVIVDGDVDVPYGLAVGTDLRTRERLLFWSEAGRSTRIVRSSLGGINQRVLRLPDRRPTSMAIDSFHQRVYWLYVRTDGTSYGIGSSRLDLGDVRQFEAPDPLLGIYSDLAVFKANLFVLRKVETDEHELHVYNIAESGNLSEIPVKTRLHGEPFGILALDSGQQYLDNSRACRHSSCPGICLTRRQCICTREQMALASAATIRSYCRREAFAGLLFPKGDGIFRVERNFAEYRATGANWFSPRPVVPTQGAALRAMTSHFWAQELFYYDHGYGNKAIRAVHTSRGSSNRVISLAVSDVGRLAVDWINKNLYWTDRKLKHIMVSKTDGRHQVVLLRSPEPLAIAVNPLNRFRFLFWSDMVNDTISRAFLDGSETQVICGPARMCRAVDITVDLAEERVYWCTETLIVRAELDGSGHVVLVHMRTSVFSGITLMADYIVFAEKSHKASGLRAYDKVDQTYVGDLLFPWYQYGNFFGVTYHHRLAQPKSNGICTIVTSCDQLCLPSNRTFTCACTLGYTLVNRTKCVIDDRGQDYFLLVSDLRFQKLLHRGANRTVPIPAQGLKQPLSVAFDTVREMVYWSDIELGAISRATLSGEKQDTLLNDPDQYYLGLAMEPWTRLLYITTFLRDVNLGKIRVLNVDTLRTYDVAEATYPTAITVNSASRHVFYTDAQMLWRMNLDGSNRTLLPLPVTSDLVASIGTSLYVAHTSTTSNAIYRCNLDGEEVALFQNFGPLTSTRALAVDRHHVYWTNTTHRRVQRSLMVAPLSVEVMVDSDSLIQPVALAVNPWDEVHYGPCSKNNGGCDDMCLPSHTHRTCVKATPINRTEEGFCITPTIKNGFIIGNQPGHVVPVGYQATVDCFPAHSIAGGNFRRNTIQCAQNGIQHVPECKLDYEICGSVSRGYKSYTEDGYFFVYPEFTSLDVICIGGGGGGYDVNNRQMALSGRAGDGGNSTFGGDASRRRYLFASGGKGGTEHQGGAGGQGLYNGGAGSAPDTCSLGGAAGDLDNDGHADNMFCGSGGFPEGCNYTAVLAQLSSAVAGPGGIEGRDAFGGRYGGGAGGYHGGSGGGGGFSRMYFSVRETPEGSINSVSQKELVKVSVGLAGTPSYGSAARGLVLVSWGDVNIDQLVKKYGHDVISRCVLND